MFLALWFFVSRDFFFLKTLFLPDAFITVLSAYFYCLRMGTKMILKIILVRHCYFKVELLVILVILMYILRNTLSILDTKYWEGVKYHDTS